MVLKPTCCQFITGVKVCVCSQRRSNSRGAFYIKTLESGLALPRHDPSTVTRRLNEFSMITTKPLETGESWENEQCIVP